MSTIKFGAIKNYPLVAILSKNFNHPSGFKSSSSDVPQNAPPELTLSHLQCINLFDLSLVEESHTLGIFTLRRAQRERIYHLAGC